MKFRLNKIIMSKIFFIIILFGCFSFSLFYEVLQGKNKIIEENRIKLCEYEKKYCKDHEVCRFHPTEKLNK